MSQINITDSPYPGGSGSTPMINLGPNPPPLTQASSPLPPSNPPLTQALSPLPPAPPPPPPPYFMMSGPASNTALPLTTSNPQIFAVGNTAIGGSSNQPLVQLAVIVIPSNAENPLGGGDDAALRNTQAAIIKKEAELGRNPCYAFGFSMLKGARMWASVNLIASVVDLMFTFVHLLYLYRVMRVSSMYYYYFQLFHAMECPSTLKVDITLSFVGSIFNVMAACLFFYATYFVKDKQFRHRLCLLFNHLLFVPILFCLPRFIIGFYGENQAGKEGSNCVLKFDGNAATNFWVLNIGVLVGYLIWFAYGLWVSDAFVRWLVILSEVDKAKREQDTGEGVDDEDKDEA